MVATRPPLEAGGAAKQGHTSHVFSGWRDFLDHIRQAHGLEPLKDDGETWLIHDSLHSNPVPRPPAPNTAPRAEPSDES